jgi:GNAT superfamily N-acetyltransferase
VRIAAESFDAADSLALCAAQQADIQARYDFRDTEPGVKPSAADITVFLVARDDDGTPLGCGALRGLDGGVVELKRMYTVPAARGRGVGRAVLEALEAEARARGFTLARLETGDLLPEAHRLYARAGYQPIPCWGAYANSDISLCFERPLSAPEPATGPG